MRQRDALLCAALTVCALALFSSTRGIARQSQPQPVAPAAALWFPNGFGESSAAVRAAESSAAPRSAAAGPARASSSPPPPPPPPPPPLKIAAAGAASNRSTACAERRLLHWNILDGGGSRLDGIGALVRAGGYDVVTLNELNGFSAVRLKALAARWGFAHSAFLHKSAYNLGMLSRTPLERVKLGNDEIFAHGLLCADAAGVRLCVTHLNPHDVGRRANEARAIVARVPPRAPFLLVGDLNTLSPADRALHEAAALPAVIRSGPHAKALGKKFLTRSGDAVDYAPMAALLDGSAALIDVAPPRGSCTVPTAINADKMHFARLRLDYALASPSLARGACAPPRATVLNDTITNTLSDHLPLAVTFSVAA